MGGAMRSKPVFDPRWEFLTRPCCECWYGNTYAAAWGRYTGITLVLENWGGGVKIGGCNEVQTGF